MATTTNHVIRLITTMEAFTFFELTDGKQFSRLLYTNPVCFLSSLSDDNFRNVMVLSWLTATNNAGSFCFSIHQNRHTAIQLKEHFSLSVPTSEMEQLVLNVGKSSGKWGTSKFPEDHHHPQQEQHEAAGNDEMNDSHNQTEQHVSKRQQKKRKVPQFPLGIPGLKRVPRQLAHFLY
jgi:hypothetical protein